MEWPASPFRIKCQIAFATAIFDATISFVAGENVGLLSAAINVSFQLKLYAVAAAS
jgi:hypothetical protein